MSEDLAICADDPEWARREIEEFGHRVYLRAQADSLEVYVFRVWHKCSLLDLNMSSADAFIRSVQRIVFE